MAIEGKKKYQLYLDKNNVEFLRTYFDTRPNAGGISGLLDKYIARCVVMVKENRETFDSMEPGSLTLKTFWKLCKINIKMQKNWKDKPNNPA